MKNEIIATCAVLFILVVGLSYAALVAGHKEAVQAAPDNTVASLCIIGTIHLNDIHKIDEKKMLDLLDECRKTIKR